MKISCAFVLSGLFSLALGQMEKKITSTLKTITKRDAGDDTTVLNYALTLEYLERAFYEGALKKFSASDFVAAGYSPYVRQRLVEIGEHEQNHAQTLASVLGPSATKPCTYTFPYTNVDEFLALARIIEGVGVSAYSGAAGDISNKNILEVAATILSVEARHQAELSEFQHADGAPSAYDTPLDFSQVYSLAAPFIKNCPSTNPALPVARFPTLTFTTPSGKVTSGSTLTFAFESTSNKPETYYAFFLNQISSIVVQLNGNKQAVVPNNIPGRTYVVISNSKTLSDAHTVAGPAFFEMSQADQL